MLNATDVPAGYDARRLAGIRAGVKDLLIRKNRFRREAASIGVAPDCPECHQQIASAEPDMLLLADVEVLLTELLVAAAARPKAPALTRPPATDPIAPLARFGVLDRVYAALGRPALSRAA